MVDVVNQVGVRYVERRLREGLWRVSPEVCGLAA
jgi:hypothetical protein